KGTASLLGKSELPLALNGMLLGTGSRALSTGLDWRTWTDKDGNFTLDGVGRTWSATANKEAVASDIVSFSAGMAATGVIGKLWGGTMANSLPLARMISGATFGATS